MEGRLKLFVLGIIVLLMLATLIRIAQDKIYPENQLNLSKAPSIQSYNALLKNIRKLILLQKTYSPNSLQNLSDVKNQLFIYRYSNKLMHQIGKLPNDSIQDMVVELKEIILNTEKIHFPIMRRIYAQSLNQELLNYQVKVMSLGAKAEILQLTGQRFSMPNNIEKTQMLIDTIGKELHFNQMIYKLSFLKEPIKVYYIDSVSH